MFVFIVLFEFKNIKYEQLCDMVGSLKISYAFSIGRCCIYLQKLIEADDDDNNCIVVLFLKCFLNKLKLNIIFMFWYKSYKYFIHKL